MAEVAQPVEKKVISHNVYGKEKMPSDKHIERMFKQDAAAKVDQPAAIVDKVDVPVNPEENKSPAAAQEEKVEPVVVDKDKEFLDNYNARFGTKFATLAEINAPAPPVKQKTKEEIEVEEEQERTSAFKWAIDNKEGFKAKYERKVADSEKDDRAIALHVFATEARIDNKDLKDDEIEELFKDFYREEDTEGATPARKSALKLMAKTAEQYRKENYGDVDGHLDAYREYKSFEQKAENFGRSVKKVVDEIPDKIAIPYKLTKPDGTIVDIEVPFEITAKDRAMLKDDFYKKSEKKFLELGGNEKEVDPKDIHQATINHLKGKRFDDIIQQVATSVANMQVNEAILALKGGPATKVAGIPEGVVGEKPVVAHNFDARGTYTGTKRNK